jgi:predicted MFS family arabinose efflux permease
MSSAAKPEIIESESEPVRGFSRTFRAFKYRNFRLLWFGAFTSSSGTWMQEAAMGFMVYELTQREWYQSLNSALAAAPILLFSLLGGVVADRVDRRKILMTSQWLQLIFAFALSAFAYYQFRSIYPILMISFLTGCAQAFGGPAYQALMPVLVGKKEDMPNAVALNSMQFNLARTLGPALGGFVLATMGASANNLNYDAAAVCFAINGFTFIAVVIALIMLQVPPIIRDASKEKNIGGEIKQGLSFVWSQDILRSLTFISFSATFFGIQFITFLYPLTIKHLGKGLGTYSTLLSISGAGSAAGALFSAWLGDAKNKGQKILMLQIGGGLALMLVTLSSNVWLAFPMVFIASGCLISTFSLTSSLVQLLVPDNMRGRVMSIYMVAFRGGIPLGAMLTGWLTDKPFHIPLARVLMGEAVMLTLIAIVLLLTNSKVKST